MQDRFEELIKAVYKSWKSEQPKIEEPHPDEETLACFLEARLAQEENARIRAHLLGCTDCLDAVVLNLRLKAAQTQEVPQELLERVRELLLPEVKTPLLEIILQLKEKVLELVNTSGDVLVGQEFVPAPVLRSRSIKDFKDEVTILKDFEDIRVEAKIENKGGKAFNLIIAVKQKQTQRLIKDLRVTLLKDDIELESYLTDSGSVTFEHVLLGKYSIEISNIETKLASIILDIKK